MISTSGTMLERGNSYRIFSLYRQRRSRRIIVAVTRGARDAVVVVGATGRVGKR